MLYTILIADDDPSICDGLELLINWNSYGFHIISKVYDGAEAANYLKENHVDLLITDIRMPKLDGISLIQETCRNESKPHIIVLSGYSDFEYATAAMEYGVKRYLLKPVQEEKLVSALKDIRKELDMQKDVRIETEEKNELIESSMLKLLISGHTISGKSFAKFGLNGNYKWFQLAVIKSKTMKTDKISDLNIMAENTFLVVFDYCHMMEYSGYIVIVLAAHNKESLSYEHIFRDFMTKAFQSGIHLGCMLVSKAQENMEGIGEVFHSCVDFLNCNVQGEDDSAVYFQDKAQQNRVLQKIIQVIQTNYSEKITLRSLSASFYINPAYLGRLFKKNMGVSFNEYLLDIRMSNAMKLLKNTTLSIADISERVGYFDVDYFSKLFKQRIGITPSDYRANTVSERKACTEVLM